MDCVILGLLSHEELTGYEIKKRMDTVLKCFWGASYGSIYPTLNGLVKQGLAIKREENDTGRNRIIYTITQKGRDYLRDWLTLPVERDEIRYETLLKLFFGSEIGTMKTIEHIENFQMKIRNELPALLYSVETLKRIQDTEESHRYYLLTAMFGVKVYCAYLEWCAEAKLILGEKKGDN